MNGLRNQLSISGFAASNKIKFIGTKTGVNGGFVYSNNELGMTFTNVYIENTEALTAGGLIYATEVQPINLNNVNVKGVKADGNGGMINVQKASSITM